MLNTRQRLNMDTALRFARVNNSKSEMSNECSEEDIKYQFDPGTHFDSSYKMYKKDDIDFSIIEKGLVFTYDFGFPHVIRACEPEQMGMIPYQELKLYTRPDGLLEHEIR